MLTEPFDIASEISELQLVFKGAESSPFLAPRGIWLTENKLMVSDTGQNRVFIWNHVPGTEFAEPDVILGQDAVGKTGRNQDANVSATSLHYPSGIWSDGDTLMVADAWNHRVLIWHTFPTEHGQPADVVLGQPTFNQNEPNVEGLQKAPSAQSLYWPYGLHSDGKQLWIADTGNRRVLYFPEIPTENFTPASEVIGKPSFSTRDYEDEQAIWPYSVRINSQGNLAITDTQYFRVLLWGNWKSAIGEKVPEAIIGQPDVKACGQNQYGLFPSETSLNWCYDSFFHENGILVLDTANSRVKWHRRLPKENNPPADALLGQPNFSTSSENALNLNGTDSTLYWPFSLCVNGKTLALADTGNHRILLNRLTI